MLIEVTRPSEVTLGRRDPSFYVAVLKNYLNAYPNTEFLVKGIGRNTINAVQTLGYVSKQLESHDGSRLVYGDVLIDEKHYPENSQYRSTIIIPCMNNTKNPGKYRTIRDLNENPWPDDVFTVLDKWRETLPDLFEALKAEREISLIGSGSSIRSVFNLCNILRRKMVGFTLEYDVEIGLMLTQEGPYDYSIKIKVRANEMN